MQNAEKNHTMESGGENKNFLKRISDKLADKDEEKVRVRLKYTVNFFLTLAAAYLLGGAELFFGTFPLCVALVCSDRRKLLPISAGILVLFISKGVPTVTFLSCGAVILIRILVTLVRRLVLAESKGRAIVEYGAEIPDEGESRKEEQTAKLFCEEMRVKMLCGATGGLICGVARLIENDFSFYSLIGALFLTLSVPLAALLLGGVFGEEKRWKWYSLLSLGAVFFFCVFASLDKSLLGMPMAPFLGTLLTLFVCSERGLLYGALTAILCGLSLEIIYLPLLLLVAILFCLVSAVKRNMGLPAVCALVVVWCYYIGGERGLVSYLPPMLLAIPFYYIADKYREIMKAPYLRDSRALSGVFFAEAVTEKTKNEVAFDRLEALSGAFSSLSETFYKLSDRFRRPDVLGIKRIAETSFEKHCHDCRNREICWGPDYSRTLEAIRCISAELHKKGVAADGCLAEDFKSACLHCDKIIDEVNRSIQRTTEDIIRGEKASIFSVNYDDMTAILKDALESDSEEYESDIEVSGKVFDCLCAAGIRPKGVVVYGKRCRHVVARGVTSADKIDLNKMHKLCCEIGNIVGAELGEPVFEVGKDGQVMVMHSKPTIRAHCAHGRALHDVGNEQEGEGLYVDPFSEQNETVCGDTTGAFVTDMSYFYSLISDGMGSGEEAAFTSNVCAIFIEKMLSAGNRADITLRMLNNVIRSENLGLGSECSATVDLFELDLMNGKASFIKSGAAPTYVARGGTVYKVSSRTMPVGIIKDADARITHFDTQKGDLIVMISDGCCPDSDDCTWLVEYLCAYASKKDDGGDKASLCERIKGEILAAAVKNYPPDRALDDISVSVVLID